MQVNILEAKTNLSNLVHKIESREEESIIISRYGKPVARLIMYQNIPKSKRIGVAKGKLKSSLNFDEDNKGIESLFEGDL